MTIEFFKKKSITKYNKNLFVNNEQINKKYNSKKKILIYQSGDFHTEIAGFIIYYYNNYTIDIYHPFNKSSNNCFSYYEKIFKIKMNYINVTNEDEYEYIFMLTSREIKTSYIKNFNKYILFKHVNEDNFDKFLNISLTPIVSANSYILPIYNNPNQNKRHNIICIIGNMSCNKIRDIDGTIKLIGLLKSFHVYIFTRKIKDEYKSELSKFDNCSIYINMSTETMIDKIRRSKFILTADTKYYSENGHSTGVLTGMIPLALNNDVPLILSKNLNKIYNIKGVIEYDELHNISNQINNMDNCVYNSILKCFVSYKNDVLVDNKRELEKKLNLSISI